MKKYIIFLMVCFICIQGIISKIYAISFIDIKPSFWGYSQITELANEGIIKGYEDGTYKPEKAVTRGEFLKLIMTTLYGGEDYFKVNNIQIGHWATPYAIEAALNGYLMDGTSIDNLDAAISREEMVNILAKICIQNKIQNKNEGKPIIFSDIQKLNQTSQLFIEFVSKNGLINGYEDGTFKPNKSMTRAEVATVIGRVLSLIK